MNPNTKRYRAFIGTYNNPPEGFDLKNWLEAIYVKSSCRYLVGQLEKASTLHVQYYIYFSVQCTISQLKKKVCAHSHFEPVIINNGADDYCMKEDTRVEGPYEFGTKPKNKVTSKVNWDLVKEEAKKSNWDEIPSDIYIRYYGNLKKIGAESTEKFETDEVRGYWLWGEPGTGKTTFARTEYGDDVFIKS